MKLNPLKCSFEVNSGKFLGFFVTQRRIEANPIQLKAIMESQSPTSKKGVQRADWPAGSSHEIHILFHILIKTIFLSL